MNMDSNVNLTSRYDERFSNLRLSPHNYEKTSYSFNEDITRTDNNFTRMKEDKIYRQYKNNMPNKAVGNKEKLLTNVEQEVNQIERLIPVKIKSEDKDDWIRELKISMNINVVSPSKQIITINLTDPVDPLFLFSIDIGEQEFHYLKQEQSLLIEFQHFPQIFFEMLDMCSKSYSKQSGSYNYICILHHREQKDALLIIQERTQFKEVNHLILAVKQANDATLKRHLSNLAKYFKTKSEILVSENSKLCESIDSFVIEVKNLKEELQNLKYQQGSELEALRLTHQKEINEMKEKLYNENKTKMDTKEDEFNQHTHELESKITELSNKLDLLTKDKLTLEENNIKLFASERDLIGRNNILSSELAIYKEEVNVLRNDNSSLNQATFVKEKQITELTYKNENLFAQLQEKDINIQNLNALVENLSTQRTELEENLKGVRATNTKLEDKLQSSINEINKGNDIIQKLQAEIKTQKQKVKLKQQSITTQEQLINQKQIQIDDLIKANNELKREVDKKEEETKSNRMNESNLKANLEEAKKIIEENEKLIRFLNKNLNENQNPFRNFMNEKTGIDNLSTRQLETNTKNPDFVSGSSFGKQPYFNTDSFQPSETNQKMIMPETNFAGLKPGTKELKATGLSNTNYETGKYLKPNPTGSNLLSHKYGGSSNYQSSRDSNIGDVNKNSNYNYEEEEPQPSPIFNNERSDRAVFQINKNY